MVSEGSSGSRDSSYALPPDRWTQIYGDITWGCPREEPPSLMCLMGIELEACRMNFAVRSSSVIAHKREAVVRRIRIVMA